MSCMQNNAWLLGAMLQRLKERVCNSKLIEGTPCKKAPESEITLLKDVSFTDLTAKSVQVCEQSFLPCVFRVLSPLDLPKKCCLQTP